MHSEVFMGKVLFSKVQQNKAYFIYICKYVYITIYERKET